MKKIQKKNWKSIPFKAEDLKFYTMEEVFGEASKTEEFKRTYREEGIRLMLAKQLKQARTSKRLTQKQVAERAAMPQSVIARLESGEHSASINTLGKVASALGREIALVKIK